MSVGCSLLTSVRIWRTTSTHFPPAAGTQRDRLGLLRMPTSGLLETRSEFPRVDHAFRLGSGANRFPEEWPTSTTSTSTSTSNFSVLSSIPAGVQLETWTSCHEKLPFRTASGRRCSSCLRRGGRGVGERCPGWGSRVGNPGPRRERSGRSAHVHEEEGAEPGRAGRKNAPDRSVPDRPVPSSPPDAPLVRSAPPSAKGPTSLVRSTLPRCVREKGTGRRRWYPIGVDADGKFRGPVVWLKGIESRGSAWGFVRVVNGIRFCSRPLYLAPSELCSPGNPRVLEEAWVG